MGILAILLNFAELGANDGMILSTLVRSAQPPAPWASSCLINSGDKNSLPYQNNLLQGISNINFVFIGESKIRQFIVFFLCPCWSCACRPLPTGRFCARPAGGGPVLRLLCLCCPRCRPAAGRFGRATRSVNFLIGNFHRPVPLQDVYAYILM
jgi:hypothetical protein